MKKFQCRQIWLVNFDPSYGHEYKKIRPALIIQNNKYIESSNLLTVIPISSQIKKQTELDVLLRKDSNNRLMTDSMIKTKQISSFDKRRFIKLIGTIDEEIMGSIIQSLKKLLT